MTQRDPVTIARGIVAAPRKLSTVATSDMLAICQALVDAEERPQISNELASAIRSLIAFAARNVPLGLGRVRHGDQHHFVELERLLATLTTTFEEEFPDV